jgi:hypothetical protein
MKKLLTYERITTTTTTTTTTTNNNNNNNKPQIALTSTLYATSLRWCRRWGTRTLPRIWTKRKKTDLRDMHNEQALDGVLSKEINIITTFNNFDD